jgi:multidrug efflux pump subunit AcrA (membrane-fusion protein)
MHYSFQATSLVYPAKEWYLKKAADDSYVSELHDFEADVISHMIAYKFERGDISELLLNTGFSTDDFVKKGDTVAYIRSYLIDNEIVRLRNMKEVEKAYISVSNTGAKKELIDEAEKEYEFAKLKLSLEQKNFKRQQKLFQDSIISEADFEVAENAFHLAKVNVQIAESELISIQTGKKAEEISLIYQKIDSYANQIENLEKLLDQYYIKPPISGRLRYSTSNSGIISVSDTGRYILKIPVKVNNIQYLTSISGIRFSVPGYDDEIEASFAGLDNNVNVAANEQMLIAKAVINLKLKSVYPGMAVQCEVICDKITIFEFLKRGIHLRL